MRIVFALSFVTITGCSAWQLMTGTVEVGVAKLGEVEIRVIGTDGTEGIIGEGHIRYNKDTATVDSSPSVTFGDTKVEIAITGHVRRLIVNGQGFGDVSAGDRVVVTEDRKVEVNGETRQSTRHARSSIADTDAATGL